MKTLQTMACSIAFTVPHVLAAQANPPQMNPGFLAVAQLTYQSAFDDYQPYEDVPVADWRQVNDTVRDAAGKGRTRAAHATPNAIGSEGLDQGREAAPLPARQRTGQEMHGDQGMQRGHGKHGGTP